MSSATPYRICCENSRFIPSNWMKVSPMGTFWSIAVEKLSVNGHGISARGLSVSRLCKLEEKRDNANVYESQQAVLDPGYNVIAMPFAEAQKLYSHVTGAVQNADYPNRWVSWNTYVSLPAHLDTHCLALGVGRAVRQPNIVLCPDQFADVHHSHKGLDPKANLARLLGLRGILGCRHVTRSGRADSYGDTFFGVLLHVSLECV